MEQVKQQLLETLKAFDIPVVAIQEKMLYIKNGYTIEIENPVLFKLSQDQQVIAPFNDLQEMGEFLKNCLLLDE